MDYDVVQQQQLCSALFQRVNIHPIWQGAPVVRQSVCCVYILRIQTLRVMIMMMFKYSYIRTLFESRYCWTVDVDSAAAAAEESIVDKC